MRLLISLLLLISLSSCSFKSVIIPNLAFIIADRIDSRFHLYNDQEYQVRAEINQLLKEEKGRIVSIQKYYNSISPKNLDEKKGYGIFAENYKAVALKVNRILARQLAQLDQNQIQKFKREMKEENEEIEERTKERRPKDFYKRYSYFFGELTENQKILIADNMQLFRDLAKKRMEERRRTQRELLSILKVQDKEKKEKSIIKIFDKNADRSELTPERLKSIAQFKRFMQTVTPEQEEYFNKKKIFFNEWINAYLKYY